MYSPRKKLKTPQNYDFPYEPYAIQQDLMESLYNILERKQIGIFESPTGTGKSLTLTCGALRWLLDHEALVKEDLQGKLEELAEEIQQLEHDGNQAANWIDSQFQAVEKKQEMENLRRIKDMITSCEEKITRLREKKVTERMVGYRTGSFKNDHIPDETEKLFEENLELDEYNSESDQKELEKTNGSKDVKIFFTSRTHSQLSQVVDEIKRTKYGKQVRCITLASRQNLCIHPEVRKLNSVALINERCLNMQRCQSKTTFTNSDGCCAKKSRLKQSSNSSCEYKKQALVESLRDSVVVDILDIEELVTAGESLKSCPYYATRASVEDAQIIMLPYQLLLHKRAREQMGISLKSNVIIIDEAHNLLDTISSIYSSEMSLWQLSLALAQISAYKRKYCARFSTQNLLKINQMIFITKRLTILLSSENGGTHKMLTTHALMAEGEFFNINLFQIIDFCEQTRFAQKLQGFAKRMNAEPAPSENKEPQEAHSATIELLKKLEAEKHGSKEEKPVNEVVEVVKSEPISIFSVIRPLLAFLESLTECSDNGGVLLTYSLDPKLAKMKFVLLNPGRHFEEIIREARSIIIAGGTMRPTEELTEQLFKACPERVQLKLYDHVVSDESVAPFVVQKGPTGKRFIFNFSHRSNTEMLSELGMALQNVCNVVPAGVVCFFPSYDYLEDAFSHFTKQHFISAISQKKHIFREPRGGGQAVEKLLIDYANSIKDQDRNGALLFSVVGGKLSEGLNFCDNLGRCVIVVGMPYPNKNSPELQEKMKYLDVAIGAGSGSQYYENLCMKSVNQCIGRSVRHINDYAAVMLIDERYANEKVRKKLPQWISRNLKIPPSFGMIQGATAKFFRQKRAGLS